MPHRLLALALIAASAAAGCSTTSVFERVRVGKASPQNPAVEVVCLWSPARGNGPNGMPTRGVAGQIMFFTRGNAAPVVVDGDVRIYEFDDQGTPDEAAKPIHQFDFRAEDWSHFLNQGTLGPCYSVFIPYVRGGHKQVECTMQMRFTPKAGPALYSDMTSVTLPGAIEQEDTGPLRGPEELTRAMTHPVRTTTSTPSAASAAPGRPYATSPMARATSPRPSGDIVQVGATSEATEPPNGGAIQQASYQVAALNPASDAGPLPATNAAAPNASDERIHQLERMVQQLLEQQKPQKTSPPSQLAPASTPQSALTSDADAPTTNAAPRRFKLKSN